MIWLKWRWALIITAVMLAVYAMGYFSAKRHAEALLLAKEKTWLEQEVQAREAFTQAIEAAAVENQKWQHFSQDLSVKLARSQREADILKTRLNQEVNHAVEQDKKAGHCVDGLGPNGLRLYQQALGYE